MNTRQHIDTGLSPSTHDLHTDANIRPRGLPADDRAAVDAHFGYGTERDELTEREIDALYVAEMTRRDALAAKVQYGVGMTIGGGRKKYRVYIQPLTGGVKVPVGAFTDESAAWAAGYAKAREMSAA